MQRACHNLYFLLLINGVGKEKQQKLIRIIIITKRSIFQNASFYRYKSIQITFFIGKCLYKKKKIITTIKYH